MDFYFLNGSPPCHTVLMAAKALQIELNTKNVDYIGGEHLKPEFLKINPQHTLPTIVDDGFALWESRAIITYLADSYAKTYSWYPKDAKKRAVVNQRLIFDMGLYQHFCDYYFPQLIAKVPANQEIFKKIEAAMGFLNTFLDGQKYVCGNTITLADISLVSTISCYESAKFNISKYPNVEKWYKQTTSVLPGFDLIQDGLAVFRGFVGTLDPVN